ncbi:uncharacterized protein DS421_14g481240 [Arachis hypogaea]|nr:uncharacterized protein DS421_14g481240 [Arachis hypogaea]
MICFFPFICNNIFTPSLFSFFTSLSVIFLLVLTYLIFVKFSLRSFIANNMLYD